MCLTIGFELVLCAILVITSGISLVIFMETLSPSNLHTTNQVQVHVVRNYDNGSNDNKKNIEFMF